MQNDELQARVRIMLPDNYRDTYEQVAPVPMRSAGLKFHEGRVAWNEMWSSFCDLAMAGGPPHRGTLLEPATEQQVREAPAVYDEVVAEICRGIHLVTGLYATASPVLGWIQMYCTSAAMADWLARAITMENVSAHRQGLVLHLPAGPAFRIRKEIKNVVTSVAKTTHYWLEHTAEERREAIGRLFTAMRAEGALLQPVLQQQGDLEEHRLSVEQEVQNLTGLEPVPCPYPAWMGFQCHSVPFAIALVRLLVVNNVLARREETTVFVPLHAGPAPAQELSRRFSRAYRAAAAGVRGGTEKD